LKNKELDCPEKPKHLTGVRPHVVRARVDGGSTQQPQRIAGRAAVEEDAAGQRNQAQGVVDMKRIVARAAQHMERIEGDRIGLHPIDTTHETAGTDFGSRRSY
jgi:hypothetical protein